MVAISAAHADCGRERVVVIGGPEERDQACIALREVSDCFARAGFRIQFELTVRFVTQIEINDPSTAHHVVSGLLSGKQPRDSGVAWQRSLDVRTQTLASVMER